MPRILSTNNPVVKVSGLRPSTLTTGLLVLKCDFTTSGIAYVTLSQLDKAERCLLNVVMMSEQLAKLDQYYIGIINVRLHNTFA